MTTDFVSFAKSKGLYVWLNLEGVIVTMRDSLNRAYYSKDVRPTDIIVKNDGSNRGSAGHRETLKKAT